MKKYLKFVYLIGIFLLFGLAKSALPQKIITKNQDVRIPGDHKQPMFPDREREFLERNPIEKFAQVMPKLVRMYTQYDSLKTRIGIVIDLREFIIVVDARVHMTTEAGIPDYTLFLFDDGMHEDSLAGDNIWGNCQTFDNFPQPLHGDVVVDIIGAEKSYPKFFKSINFRPPPELINWHVVWENGRQDLSVNPGEKVHLAFSLRNRDARYRMYNITIYNLEPVADSQMIYISPLIPPGGVYTSPDLYLKLLAPLQGDSMVFTYRVDIDFNENYILTSSYPIVPWNPPPGWGDTLQVTAIHGNPQNVFPIVADPSQTTGHDYRITFIVKNIYFNRKLLWRLEDLTEGVTKLDSAELGHDFNADMPVIDGVEWKVIALPPKIRAIVEVANRLGALPPDQWDAEGTPFRGNSVWHSQSALSDLFPFYISAGGGLGNIERMERNIENALSHDFEIRFTDSDSSVYLHWYGNDTYEFLPITAWDIGVGTYEDTTDDVRILTGGGVVEGTGGFWDYAAYNDPWGGSPATDWLYLRVPTGPQGTYAQYYDEVVNGPLNYDFWGDSKEVLARIIFCDPTGHQTHPESGTIIRFITEIGFAQIDTFLVTTPTRRVLYQPEENIVSLEKNYPNPFNPVTHIRFRLQKSALVKLEVFNILGQRVKTLVDKKLAPGQYNISWDSRNEFGKPVGSGVYFCRLKAGNFSKTRKMILLK